MTFRTLAHTTSCLALLAVLSACASKPQISSQAESSRYKARAGRTYTPPGPASDPWGPYIREAAGKFDVPDRWIREVMRQESGGRLYGRNGDLVTSGAGAMGLMQVMPATYDEIRGRYPELGDDPYDPHNNIMAGTAYIREMFDIYGSPGFLAAYNAGPGRLDDYLTRNRILPEETRRYVAAIGPRISGVAPNTPSPGAQYAMNALPYAVPAGERYATPTRYAVAAPSAPIVLAPRARPAPERVEAPIQLAQVQPVAPQSVSGTPFIVLRPQTEVAQLPEPSPSSLPEPISAPPPPRQFAQIPEPPRLYEPSAPASVVAFLPPTEPRRQQQLAAAELGSPRRSRFALVSPANAEPLGLRRNAFAPGTWAIQVGAFANEEIASAATRAARDAARPELGSARPNVSPVRQARGTLYRARLQGLSRDSATQACERLVKAKTTCMVVSPDAQL